jgi:hypothetical protein
MSEPAEAGFGELHVKLNFVRGVQLLDASLFESLGLPPAAY